MHFQPVSRSVSILSRMHKHEGSFTEAANTENVYKSHDQSNVVENRSNADEHVCRQSNSEGEDIHLWRLKVEDLQLQNQDLRNEIKRLQRQSKQQIETFASMVHELRTPLHCITGLTDLMLLDDNKTAADTADQEVIQSSLPLSQNQLEAVQLIASSCDLLRSVVDDVLDLSKLEHDSVEAKIHNTNVNTVVKSVVDSFSAHARLTQSVSINVTIDPGQVFNIHTDSRLLRQLLFNLIGNAIKFSPEGGEIDVHVFTSESQASQKQFLHSQSNFLHISVKDYGKGIRKEDIKRIFQPFEQGFNDSSDPNSSVGSCTRSSNSKTISKKDKGTGLGLSIACKIASQLGGTITADSSLGEWSEFVISLPLDISSTEHSLSEGMLTKSEHAITIPRDPKFVSSLDNASNEVRLGKKVIALEEVRNITDIRVLVAEDNAVNQKVMHRMLQSIGIKDMDFVSNGKEAVEMASKKQYNIIFMDIQMPVMDGLEATKQIVAATSTSPSTVQGSKKCKHHKPMICFLSAHASEDFKVRTQEVGGDHFITKPFQLPQIRNIICTLSDPTSCRINVS